jgi:1,2-diacylglycerol 3-alpha-glucosyltransferase
VITGRGPIRAEVVRQAATLPVPGEVSFLSDEDLRRLYNTAGLMVHASEVELEGMAVL